MSTARTGKTADLSTTVIVAGSGRSGTTWVLDSLAKPNRLRTVFEPLNSQCVPRAAKLDSSYLTPGADDPEAQALITDILRGDLRSVWANYRINPRRLNPLRSGLKQAAYNVTKLHRHVREYRQPEAAGLAVKFIRANLLLPWMCSHFDLRAVLVVRHPCAVIASRLALGGPNWDPKAVVKHYREQPALMKLLSQRFPRVDLAASTPAAELAWVWCVENVLPMHWASEFGYRVAFYEDLLAYPQNAWPEIADGLGLAAVPGTHLLESPSQQASIAMQGKSFDASHVGRWRDSLGTEQIAAADRILRAFGVREYCVSDPMPRHDTTTEPTA